MKQKKVSSIFIVLGIALTLLSWPLAVTWLNQPTYTVVDPVIFNSYNANYSVNNDGLLTATETIVADFPDSEHHGIYRFWDLAQPNYPTHRLKPTVTAIFRDGLPESNILSMQKNQRYLVARIGDRYNPVPMGRHIYTITYTIPDVLLPSVNNSGSQFQWLVVSPGWNNIIIQSTTTLKLPGKIGTVYCKILTSKNSGCKLLIQNDGSVVIKTKYLPGNSGVEVIVPLSANLPPLHQTVHHWPVLLDPILGSNPLTPLAALALSLLALLLALTVRKKLVEAELPSSLYLTPPDALGPVQTVYAETGAVGNYPLISTIFYLASLKLVKLAEVNTATWSVTRIGDDSSWSKLDSVSASLQESLGLKKSGDVFTADGTLSSGEKIQAATDELSKQTTVWSDGATLFEPNTGVGNARVIWGSGFLLSLLLLVEPLLPFIVSKSADLSPIALVGPPLPTILVLPFILLFTTLSGVNSAKASHRRTNQGTAIAAQAAGFHRILSTTSSEERFDFSARKDIFIDYIPYAVAYGVAESWANKYQSVTGQNPPIPYWYPQNAVLANSMLLYSGAAGFPGFNNSISASISSYSAFISPSISSWGVFSGGGGGGGGSW